jgi:hypothetical protein
MFKRHACAGSKFPLREFLGVLLRLSNFLALEYLKLGEATTHCPACERLIARRYLCDRCQVVSLESDEPSQGKLFNLSGKGAISPSCPGCSWATNAAVQKHRCKELGISLTTARPLCPFCNEATALPVEKILGVFNELCQEVKLLRTEQSRLAVSLDALIAKFADSINKRFDSLRKELADLKQGARETISQPGRNVIEFPVAAEDYLRRVGSNLVPIKHDYLRNMAIRIADGEATTMCLVNDDSAPDNMNYVVPQHKRFQSKSDFMAYYSDYFNCPNPSAGEITIISPAVVSKAVGGWLLHKKGELKCDSGVEIFQY